MVDFLGQKLDVGDKVVALSHRKTSSSLYLGEVERFTDKMVVIKLIKYERNDWLIKDITRISPYKVIKIKSGNYCDE